MKKLRLFTMNAIGAATIIGLMPTGSALAQTAKDTTGSLNLDEVIVTASPTGRTKMQSTDSVSTMSGDQIIQSGATNTADILRSMPGIRSDASGGNGNANITVRGLPVSAGGSRYVQFQEDGLPVLLWGDASFATPDEFMRTDYATDRVELIRGGQAATQASNAPGAIINFITKTGKDQDNSVGYTMGVGTRENRLDFNYGTALGNGNYLNIGGFNRQGGGGAINTNYNSENGGQIRANLLHDLDKGGFIQFNYKHLSDSTPSLMPVPVSVVGGTVTTLPGINPRNAYFITPGAMSRDTTLAANGNTAVTDATNGLQVKSDSFGIGSKFVLGNDWIVRENFRQTSNSGQFMAAYPQSNTTAAGAPAGSIPFTMFNTALNDLGNTFNDLKLSKTMTLDSGAKLTPTFGIFSGQQNLAETWDWNTYNVTPGGSATFGNNGARTWGNCCVKTYSVKYVENDPYASLNYINGPLTLDGGLRQQNQTVTGTNTTNNGAAFAAGSPLAPGNTWGAPSLINYQLHKINYSFGANYALEKDLSLYGSASRGYNFSPLDRMVGAVDGSSPASFNQVDQYDFGVRTRSGPLSFSGTFFIAKTNESNYDLTINQFSQNNYSANGFETEVGYHVGGFRITGNATLTNAKIVSSTVAGVNSGNAPQRQAKLTYAVTPSYSIGDFMIGGSMIGTTSSYGDMQNTVTMPGYTVFNLFTSYQFNKQMLGSISVNNLFNSLAYTEFDNVGAGTASAARALPGRTMYATLKYNF